VRRVLALIATLVLVASVAACAPPPEGVGGAEPQPGYTPQNPWDDLDQKPAAPTVRPDSTIPVVEGADPPAPDELRFILTLYDNRGAYVDLGDQGWAATVTISGLAANKEPVVVNGQPYVLVVTRVLPYAFNVVREPGVVTATLFATIGIPSGWKIRCDVEYGGRPYGGYTEGISPGDGGFHVAEVLCVWNAA